MVIIAAAIRVESPGSVLFRQERVGLGGRPFMLYKFRTMHAAAADMGSARQTKPGDQRLTRLGAFLRRHSIDELPQFINVLRGDMSVVGPRPPLPTEVELYDDQVRRRLLVRPGITGLWQVRGRSNLSWHDSVRLDESYVENWSMMSDLAISLATVPAVFRRSGAY